MFNATLGKKSYELIKFADPFTVALEAGEIILPTTSKSYSLKMKVTESTIPFVSVLRESHPRVGFGNIELTLDGIAAEAEFNKTIAAKECIEDISGNVTVSVTNLGPENLISCFTLNFTFSYEAGNQSLIDVCKEVKKEQIDPSIYAQ